MPPYQTILFDLDGTLTDSAPGITGCVRHALACIGSPELQPEILFKFIGPPLLGSFENLCELSSDDARRAVEHYRERYAEIGIFENSVYSGIPELLHELRRMGKTLILATSKPTIYAERILRHFELLPLFHGVMGSELDGRRTGKADVISAVFEEWAFADRENAVMVGDREHDILGAEINRIDSIGVTYGYGSIAELRAAKPTHIVPSPDELLKVLNGG